MVAGVVDIIYRIALSDYHILLLRYQVSGVRRQETEDRINRLQISDSQLVKELNRKLANRQLILLSRGSGF
jgi:hypothetical protein